jgi:O-acetyl-ADP-ribose deacetylase (regulator of RNase III)
MSMLLDSVTLMNGRRMELAKGDLTDEQVDVIANAANHRLQHGGGVAGAIIRKGGSFIQIESDAWVARYGSITHDRPAFTGAGNLPCRYVIHVVGPVWGEGGEKLKLKCAIDGALNMAVCLGARTLAMPPISTGIFGFPKQVAAPIFYSTIREFWQNGSDCSLDTVRITIIDEPTCRIFLKEFVRWKKDLTPHGDT